MHLSDVIHSKKVTLDFFFIISIHNILSKLLISYFQKSFCSSFNLIIISYIKLAYNKLI